VGETGTLAAARAVHGCEAVDSLLVHGRARVDHYLRYDLPGIAVLERM